MSRNDRLILIFPIQNKYVSTLYDIAYASLIQEYQFSLSLVQSVSIKHPTFLKIKASEEPFWVPKVPFSEQFLQEPLF